MIPGTQEFANMCFSRTKFTEQDILNLENHPSFEKEMNMGGLIFPRVYHLYTTYIVPRLGGQKCYLSHLVWEPETIQGLMATT